MSDPAENSLQPGELHPLEIISPLRLKEAGEEHSKAIGPENTAVRAKRGGLVVKLTIAFAVTLVALEAAILITGHHYWRDILQNQVQAHLSAVAASDREMVEAGIKLLRQQVTIRSQRGEFRRFLAAAPETPAELDVTKAQKQLERIVDGQAVFAASLADLTGKILLSTDPAEVGLDRASDRAFNRGLVDSYLDVPRRVNGRFEATTAAPVRYKGTVVGVLLMREDVAPLASPLQEIAGLGKSGEIMLLVREDDVIRYVLPPRQRNDLSTVRVSDDPALAALLAKVGTFLQMPDYRGQLVLAASSPTHYEGWSVVVKTDEAEAYAPIDRALRGRILVGTLIAAAGTVAAYAFVRGFARPLRRLAAAAAQVAGGDYRGSVPVNSDDEVGALSTSFNEMTAAICARGAERDEAEAALRLADRRKDDFLAILGHELRNPVAAINAGVTMWKESEGNPAAAKFIQEVIHRQTGHLKRLVDDLLDVARITTGKVDLRRSPVNVSEMISYAVNSVRPFMEERRHQLDVSPATGPPIWVDADATRIEQVLTNLLTNAAKYTPDGGRIAVARRLEGGEVAIVVSDNGIGLADDMLAHIFDLFIQGDASLHRTDGGLGIGLCLSRQLVELHGGTLTARSDGLRRGAQFILRLPVILAPSLCDQPAPVARVTGPGRRILLVDDNKDTTRLLSQLLERRGHQVCVAYDGRAGLEAAQNFKPDVFILDIGLPEIDGYELARRFRTEGFADALIIALSGYAQEGDRARAREAGFDYHFAKPMDLNALAALILGTPPSKREAGEPVGLCIET